MNDSSIYIYNLTRNVSISHLKEIFMNFGTLKDVHYMTYDEEGDDNNKDDDKNNYNDDKNNNIDDKNNYNDDNYKDNICAHIKYENSKEAQTAKEFMDGGQIDGKIISIKYKINHKYIKK
ncbi:RNA-binding protein s1,putative [Plasmodium sp. gorilla clade G2]|uniref:RNA-binding protein s1,putative n=1 Tax=Plasmodium sp. gorilla clade G2 TaxID=880535 RepID=UPI000D203D82|nr:RNA-binding protein s1,putative [Plasmodium sp. gorilla clade G2]SOV15822.1 RNA-binding protein s1,putative [Plasmodium sp. gorilla clade G2]